MARHNIGGTGYSQQMNRKIELYNSLILRAEMALRDHNGERTPQEAECYAEASKVCQEIMNLRAGDL